MARLEIQRFFRAPRRTNVEPSPCERRSHQVPNRTLIINYEDRPWSHKHDIIVLYSPFVTYATVTSV